MRTTWLARGAVALAIAVVVLLAVAGAAGSTERGCVRCHRTVAHATRDSAHGSVDCVACHAPGTQRISFTAKQWLRMYPSALAGRDPSGPVTEIPRQNCLACHSDTLKATSSGDLSGMRIRHKNCAPDASCDKCHAGTAHGSKVRWQRQPIMEDCIACHRREGATVKCDACHAGKLKEDRVSAGPWQVTHGPQWKKTHGMGDLDSCQTCHPSDYCSRCHRVEMPHPATFGKTHGKTAIADRTACTACHKSSNFCDSCHGVKMPHPTGFLKRHSAIAKSVDNPSCLRCHDRADCEACHANHIHPGNARVSSGIATSPAGGGGQ